MTCHLTAGESDVTARARFTQADMRRAISAAVAAGLEVRSVKIAADGSIVVNTEAATITQDDWRSRQPLYRG